MKNWLTMLIFSAIISSFFVGCALFGNTMCDQQLRIQRCADTPELSWATSIAIVTEDMIGRRVVTCDIATILHRGFDCCENEDQCIRNAHPLEVHQILRDDLFLDTKFVPAIPSYPKIKRLLQSRQYLVLVAHDGIDYRFYVISGYHDYARSLYVINPLKKDMTWRIDGHWVTERSTDILLYDQMRNSWLGKFVGLFIVRGPQR